MTKKPVHPTPDKAPVPPTPPDEESGLLPDAPLEDLTEGGEEALPAILLTPEELALIPIPLPEFAEALLPAFKMGTDPTVFIGAKDGVPLYAYRSLQGVEAWCEAGVVGGRLQIIEGWPASQYVLAELGIPEPPGGGYESVYGVPGEAPQLRAATAAGVFTYDGVNPDWVKVEEQGDTAGAPRVAPGASPLTDKPDSELSVRLRRIRDSQQ